MGKKIGENYHVENPTILDDKDITKEDRQEAETVTHLEAMERAVKFGKGEGDELLAKNAQEKIEQYKDALATKERLLKVDNLKQIVEDLLNQRQILEQTQKTIEQQLKELESMNNQFDQAGLRDGLDSSIAVLREQLEKIKAELLGFEYSKEQLRYAQHELEYLKQVSEEMVGLSEKEKEKKLAELGKNYAVGYLKDAQTILSKKEFLQTKRKVIDDIANWKERLKGALHIPEGNKSIDKKRQDSFLKKAQEYEDKGEWYDAAQNYAKANQVDKSRQMWLKFAQEYEGRARVNPYYYYDTSAYYEAANQPDKAKEMALKAAQYIDENRGVPEEAGKIYARYGLAEKAYKMFLKAIDSYRDKGREDLVGEVYIRLAYLKEGMKTDRILREIEEKYGKKEQ